MGGGVGDVLIVGGGERTGEGEGGEGELWWGGGEKSRRGVLTLYTYADVKANNEAKQKRCVCVGSGRGGGQSGGREERGGCLGGEGADREKPERGTHSLHLRGRQSQRQSRNRLTCRRVPFSIGVAEKVRDR